MYLKLFEDGSLNKERRKTLCAATDLHNSIRALICGCGFSTLFYFSTLFSWLRGAGRRRNHKGQVFLCDTRITANAAGNLHFRHYANQPPRAP
jgi:hypothetical protein